MAFSAVAPRRDAADPTSLADPTDPTDLADPADPAEPADLGDPVLADGREGPAWGVRAAVRMAFAQPARQAHDAAYAARLDLYMRDMLREHGLDASCDDRDWAGWSYSEMATALIQRAVPAHESVDLLVLAYAIPDVNPGRNMAALLSGNCPGKPLAFGLSDQGVAAPFTALRLIRQYARTAGLRRALLLVVEQAALPYRASDNVAIPAGHTGVALLLGDCRHGPNSASPLRLGPIITRAGIREDAVEQELKTLCAQHTASTVILGPALSHWAQHAGALASGGEGRVRVTQAAQPLTGLWWELAAEYDARADSPRSIALCDYDPVQGCLCLAVLASHSACGHCHVRVTTRKGSAPISATAAQ